MKLEICTNSYESAINAEQAGAHRIELCSALAIGGITPSFGLLQQVLENCQLPVHVLIRPRGGDFTYSASEFEVIKKDIQHCKDLGAAGIVSGVLYENNSLDVERTKTLVQLAKPLPFTFHRAFDWVTNPLETLKILESIGVDCVLSSGQEVSAENGIDLLKQMRSSTTVMVMPGGGIGPENVALFKESGFPFVHASATKTSQSTAIPKVSMNSLKHLDETVKSRSDTQVIKQILEQIHAS